MWLLPALAALMLALILIPAEFWRAPAVDATYTGFDPKLVYAADGTGSVHVSKDAIELNAPAKSMPTAILATTLFPKVRTSLDVTVADNAGAAEPLRVGMWSPWTSSGYFVVFGPAPTDAVTLEKVENGPPGSTLLYGDVTGSRVIGKYQLGAPYHVAFGVDKTANVISVGVSGPGALANVSLRKSDFPALFANVQLSLSASADAGAGVSQATLRDYVLTLPHERQWASKADDSRLTFLMTALAALGLLALAVAAAVGGRAAIRSRSSLRFHVTLPDGRPALWIGAAVVVYLVGNAALFALGGHPFDMGVEKLSTYVARAYGPAQLYYLPNVISLPAVWNGTPEGESAFPYGAVFAYFAAGIGWLASVVFSGQDAYNSNLNAGPLEYLFKSVNVLFGLADGVLIYAILRHLNVRPRHSLIASSLFVFNPAVWFSMSVWGQTHVISIFFVLAAVLLAEKNQPTLAWLALAGGLLTRPQMLVFGLLLGVVFLRKFPLRTNIEALSWAVIVTFLFLLPLTLATSPSLPLDITFHNLRVQQGGGNVAAVTTVSQDAYTIWPLLTYVTHGASGLERGFTPVSEQFIGPLTYQRTSQALTLAALLFIAATLFFKKGATEAGNYIPLVALGMVSFLMLITGVVATHFLLALPFLVLIRRWVGGVAYFYIVAIWSVAALVPMIGDMGLVVTGASHPLFAPERNPITKFITHVYASDRFINIAVVGDAAAFLWLAVLALRSSAPLRRMPE